MVIYQNQYINLYPLIQITFKILYTYNLHFRKRNIFQDLKVLVFCNNTLCICSNGTIYKLNLKIIILVYCMEYVHGDAGNSRYVLHSGFLHSTSYLIQHQPSEQNNRRLPYSNLAKPQES